MSIQNQIFISADFPALSNHLKIINSIEKKREAMGTGKLYPFFPVINDKINSVRFQVFCHDSESIQRFDNISGMR